MQKYVVIALIFILIVAVFVILNNEVTTLNLVFANYEISLGIIILISFIAGVFMMFLMNLVDKFKKRSEINGYKKQINELEKRLVNQRKELDQAQYPTEEWKNDSSKKDSASENSTL